MVRVMGASLVKCVEYGAADSGDAVEPEVPAVFQDDQASDGVEFLYYPGDIYVGASGFPPVGHEDREVERETA